MMFCDAAAALDAGFRACLRCRPDQTSRDQVAVARAITIMEEADQVPKLVELAAAVGYAPYHFQRLFKKGYPEFLVDKMPKM